jgi:CheY-like chemotaxis protein
MGQVENELGLSRRQLQRETLKGLEALTSMLWANHRVKTETSPTGEADLVKPLPELGNELDPLEMELNQWNLSLQNCDVHSLVDDTRWLLRSTREANEIEMQVDFPAILPPVFVDATLTRQALFKIMRWMIRNSKSLISLRATPIEKFVVLQMQTPDCVLVLDESDWRVAERIMNYQGGGLELENSATLGFQVIIHLPLASQTRILIIDDNQAILQLFERYLTPQHYGIKKVQGGSEALLVATEDPPDLIILDVMMPSMDGWQVLRSLKQNPVTEHTPIIVCSVLKEAELAISLGADAYLKKPVDRLELLATVERILHP